MWPYNAHYRTCGFILLSKSFLKRFCAVIWFWTSTLNAAVFRSRRILIAVTKTGDLMSSLKKLSGNGKHNISDSIVHIRSQLKKAILTILFLFVYSKTPKSLNVKLYVYSTVSSEDIISYHEHLRDWILKGVKQQKLKPLKINKKATRIQSAGKTSKSQCSKLYISHKQDLPTDKTDISVTKCTRKSFCITTELATLSNNKSTKRLDLINILRTARCSPFSF